MAVGRHGPNWTESRPSGVILEGPTSAQAATTAIAAAKVRLTSTSAVREA